MGNLTKKLGEIQAKLKAPKSQWNSFGKYAYRNCEDILEAVKPLIGEAYTLLLTDEVVCVGARNYVKSTARFADSEDSSFLEVSAFAREPESKKGMDESQITGAASSYARKYALNGLFLIDDTKDADDDGKPKVDASKVDIIDALKKEVDEIKTVEALRVYYHNHGGYGADFDKYMIDKGEELKTKAELDI